MVRNEVIIWKHDINKGVEGPLIDFSKYNQVNDEKDNE